MIFVLKEAKKESKINSMEYLTEKSNCTWAGLQKGYLKEEKQLLVEQKYLI